MLLLTENIEYSRKIFSLSVPTVVQFSCDRYRSQFANGSERNRFPRDNRQATPIRHGATLIYDAIFKKGDDAHRRRVQNKRFVITFLNAE